MSAEAAPPVIEKTWTWADKFRAINALSPASLNISHKGAWMVHQPGVSVKDGGFLVGVGGPGSTPEEAVEKHWRGLTQLKPAQYLVRMQAGTRSAYAWNGMMWEPVTEP